MRLAYTVFQAALNSATTSSTLASAARTSAKDYPAMARQHGRGFKGSALSLLLTAVVVACVAQPAAAQVGKPNLWEDDTTGNFSTDAQYYLEDSIIGAVMPPQRFAANAWTNLIYTNKNFEAGIRLESYEPPLAGYPAGQPYKGTGVLMPDLLAGRLDVAFDNVLVLATHVKSGALRALAVTGAKRSVVMPELPTISEAGVPGFQTAGWFGVLSAARTPQPVIARLNAELSAVMEEPTLKERLIAQGAEPLSGPPEALRKHLAREVERGRTPG